MCVCVDCACPTGDWPPCDRPVLTEPARVPLLARCRTGAAAAGHLHSHALLPWDALVLPRRLDMSRGPPGESRSEPVLLSRTGWRNRWRPVRCRRTSPGSAWSESLTQLMCRFCVMAGLISRDSPFSMGVRTDTTHRTCMSYSTDYFGHPGINEGPRARY